MTHAGHVRPFAQDDISQVADLYQRVYFARSEHSPPALRSYVGEVFLHNPWYDEELPSLVYENSKDQVVGFLGVIPRRMRLNGDPVRVAVTSSFMVDAESRSTLAAVHLLNTFLSGPQDLSLTDAANESSRKIWEALAGSAVALYSHSWTRLLRPARYAVYALGQIRPGLQAFIPASRPLCWALDGIANGLLSVNPPAPTHLVSEEDPDPKIICEFISQLPRAVRLRPDYDSSSLKWVWDMAARNLRPGLLRKVLVRDAQGQILGWYLYYFNSQSPSEVLQIVARPYSMLEVLGHLFYTAWTQGSHAISGQQAPSLREALFSDNYCVFNTGSWMLVHSRNLEMLQSIFRGDALITRLEGEWWACFLDFIPKASA